MFTFLLLISVVFMLEQQHEHNKWNLNENDYNLFITLLLMFMKTNLTCLLVFEFVFHLHLWLALISYNLKIKDFNLNISWIKLFKVRVNCASESAYNVLKHTINTEFGQEIFITLSNFYTLSIQPKLELCVFNWIVTLSGVWKSTLLL